MQTLPVILSETNVDSSPVSGVVTPASWKIAQLYQAVGKKTSTGVKREKF